jgi:SAM-dependent MidA family methyltransferase
VILPLVRDQIVEVIRAEGPIPFERFMDLALYGPAGFFATATLRSQRSGDFLTSPEVSPLFGEMLARYVEREHRRLGEPFTLVEVAGGSGSLLRPLLAAQPVTTWAVEVSPPARQALATLVGAERVVADAAEIPDPLKGVVLANEFVDNLPMAIAQLGESGWRERWVGIEDGALVFVDARPRPEVEAWLTRWAGTNEVGAWVEVQLAAAAWLQSMVKRLVAGSVVLIDYGDTMENLVPRRRDGTLRTYRAHHLGPHPLDEPGATDITADVNFTALADVAREAGATVAIHRQDDFLSELGLRAELSSLRRLELELAREGDPIERLRVRTRKTEAETLLHPRGLGDFRVLIASKA